LDGSDFKKAIGQLTGDPDAVILAGGTTNTLESWGAFGTEVRIYQNTEVVAKLVKFLKRSAKFNANAVALGKLYRSASGWSEARMKAKGEQNAKFEREWDDMTKGTYKGRPFLTVQPGETDEGAAFARGVNMWGFGDAIYHGRFLFDDIPSRLVPQIVHEVSHALRPRGSPPSDLGAAILKGIDEEVKVRQETRDILKEISAGGGVSFAASDTMPELRPGNIERDVSPGLGMTYLESIATSVWLQAAMKRDNIDWETAERLRSEAEAIFPAAPIDQRDYSKEYFKKLRLKASWKAFNASTPPTAPDYVTKRNAKADEHVQNILNSNVMYRAFLP
jgi:hypothetical protein